MLKWKHLSGALVLCVIGNGVGSAQDRTCWLRDGASPAPSLVYLLCEQGAFLVTNDGGANWSTHEIKTNGHLRNLDFIDAAHGFAVGDRGLLMATADGGKTWEARKTDLKENLTAIQFIGQSGWASGYDGVIIHSADGGRTWAPQRTGTKESLDSIFFADQDHGWAVGWAGTILRTTDGGKTWQAVKSDAAMWSLSSVYFRDAKNGWIAGFAGSILRTKDGGVTWQAQASPAKTWLTAVTFDKSNRGWIAADDCILVSEDGGESWKRINVDDLLFVAQFVPVNGSLWAVGQLGVMQLTDGLKWKRMENLVVDDPTRDTGAATAATGSKPN